MPFSKSEHAEIRRNFPVVRKYLFFNSAGVGPLSRPAKEVISRLTADMTAFGYFKLMDWIKSTMTAGRSKMARFIGATPAETAFVHNTSAGLSIVAQGVNWRPGDEVIVPDQEFPSNVYPWLNLKKRGVKIVILKSDKGRLPVDAFERAMTKKTRLVTVSAVEYSTGFAIDLSRLGGLCRTRGIYLCVDAIQSLGALPMDVRRFKIDFLSADGHKWMCGPEGAGVFYCRKELIDRLSLAMVGWNTVRDSLNFGKIDFRPKPDAGRFEEGSWNVIGIAGMVASVSYLMDLGVDRIRDWNFALRDVMEDELKKRNIRILSPGAGRERSAITVFTLGSDKRNKQAFERLSAMKAVVALRGGGIRVSPHLFNNERDILALMKIIDTIRGR